MCLRKTEIVKNVYFFCKECIYHYIIVIIFTYKTVDAAEVQDPQQSDMRARTGRPQHFSRLTSSHIFHQNTTET